MKLSPVIASAAIAACLAAPVAHAQDTGGVLPTSEAVFLKWGETEGWTIYMDGGRNTCLIERMDAAENVKPNKKKSTGRIDPAVAAIMAVGRAEVGEGKRRARDVLIV